MQVIISFWSQCYKSCNILCLAFLYSVRRCNVYTNSNYGRFNLTGFKICNTFCKNTRALFEFSVVGNINIIYPFNGRFYTIKLFYCPANSNCRRSSNNCRLSDSAFWSNDERKINTGFCRRLKASTNSTAACSLTFGYNNSLRILRKLSSLIIQDRLMLKRSGARTPFLSFR